MASEQDRKDVGAMWERTGKNGVYFGITINGEKFLAFKNNYKKEAKHPDYRIFPNTYTSGAVVAKGDLGDAPPF